MCVYACIYFFGAVHASRLNRLKCMCEREKEREAKRRKRVGKVVEEGKSATSTKKNYDILREVVPHAIYPNGG